MQLVTRDNLIDVCSLQTTPETDIKELMKPVSVLRLRVDEFYQAGIERLSVALIEPSLKMTNSERNWTIYQNNKHAIAETAGDQLYVTPWTLDAIGSFEYLKEELLKGKVLTTVQDDGYRIIARASDINDLQVSKDTEDLWNRACAAYLDNLVLTMVNWSYKARRQSRLTPLLVDELLNVGIDSTSGETVQVHSGEYFDDTIRELIAPIVNEVTEFVRQDPWAYYSVQHDRLGINVTRHRDVRALIWNKQEIDSATQDEIGREALSAWAVD